MVLLAAWQHSSLQRRCGAGGHHVARRQWLSKVPRAPSQTPPPAAPAVQPWGPAAAQQQLHAARQGVLAPASQHPAGQPTPGMDPAVAAYLEQHGISATQLQQEQPAAAAALTLPLARLLVRAMTARQGLRSNSRVTPPELVARLVFLASEAGVPVKRLEQVYVDQPEHLYFKLDSAREVLGWLRDNLSDAALQRVAANRPNIWSSLRPTLDATKRDLQQMFSLSHNKWAEAVQSEPTLLTSFSEATAVEVVGWLRSDVGMSERDVSRLFRREPQLFYSRTSRLSGVLEYLLGRLHIDRNKAGSMTLNCGTLLTSSQDALEGKIADLELYGFTADQIGKMLLGCPLLLGCTFDSVISPALSELEQLLTGHLPDMTAQERRAIVIGVAARGGGLLVSKPAKLRGNIDFMLSQGLLLDTARDVLRRNPQVCISDMESKDYGAKLRYYESVLGITPPEMLVKYSTYLKEGLEKVDKRVFCMERRGELEQLWPGGKRRPGHWMQLSLADFCDRYGVSLKEWEECMAEWPASERAQQYGLVEQASKRSFNVDKSKVSAATKAANARRREKN